MALRTGLIEIGMLSIARLNNICGQIPNEGIHTWVHVHRDYIFANNISRFLYFLTEDTILVQLQEKN